MSKENSQKKATDDSRHSNLRSKVDEWGDNVEDYVESKDWLSAWRRRLERFGAYDLGRTAAASSFYFLFSLFPLILLAFSALNIINPDLSAKIKNNLSSLKTIIPEQVLDLILGFIHNSTTRNPVPLLSISAFGLLWSASRGTGNIMNAIIRFYRNKRNINFFLQRLLGIISIIIVGFILLLVLLLMTFNRLILNWIKPIFTLPQTFFFRNFNLASYLISFTILTFLFSLIFHASSRARGLFRFSLLSALLPSLGWPALSFWFSRELSHGNYFNIYGSITGIIFLLLWIYGAIYTLLLGAFVHSELLLKYPQSESPSKTKEEDD